jgi:Nucleotide modification associated domain 5
MATTRLTESLRSAFIRAALNDVPRIDYDDQARKIILDHAIACLPTSVGKIYADPMLRAYVWTNFVYVAGFSTRIPCVYNGLWAPSMEVRQQIEAIHKAFVKQRETHETLQAKLYAVAKSARTTQQLAKMLPEFAKYLPADEAEANRNVPCIANLIADFMTAGWPKDKQPEAATT